MHVGSGDELVCGLVREKFHDGVSEFLAVCGFGAVEDVAAFAFGDCHVQCLSSCAVSREGELIAVSKSRLTSTLANSLLAMSRDTELLDTTWTSFACPTAPSWGEVAADETQDHVHCRKVFPWGQRANDGTALAFVVLGSFVEVALRVRSRASDSTSARAWSSGERLGSRAGTSVQLAQVTQEPIPTVSQSAQAFRLARTGRT